MKHVAVGVHFLREDIEPLATPIAAGDLFFSAVAVADDQPLGDRDLLLRVANIRAQLLERATFIAVRYGYTFAREVEASQLAKWKRALETNRGNVEMTLKVAAASPRERPDRKAFASGAEYLRALHESTQAAAADPRFREEAERLIVPIALQHRWTHRDEKSLELTTLIARERVEDVRMAGEELRRACPPVPFLLSGPWPLEVFADADHE
jgi:hypothetical protein